MRKLTNILILTIILAFPAYCGSQAFAGSVLDDGTMLLFVGENIELMSIASRREETPAKAPAVAKVITRQEFTRRGQRTLGRILRGTPGFHMARKESGHRPYLRGIPDSVLFLYDTVPIGSEISKSLHPIDHELSLAAVKQVEIVRGPSSVLWGPDAFAGVVNVVPLSGRDFQGAETGILYAEPGRHKGAYLNLGHDAGAWDGFVSLSFRHGREDHDKAGLVSFFDYKDNLPVPPGERTGSKRPGDARYLDAYARMNLGRGVSLSGRFSESSRPYTMFSRDNRLRWLESRDITSGYIKLDANHDLDLETRIRFSGYYSRMDPEQEIIDKTLGQSEETHYSEILADRSLFDSRGLLTAGVSFKSKKITDAPIWDSYIPGFLGPGNRSFLPGLDTEDFSNRTWSVFSQYGHKLGDFDFMLGLRQDFHREYRDNLSHSAALVWSPADAWNFKLVYGTAYRIPFARQLIEDKKPDMEKTESYSFQASWIPDQRLTLTGTLFYNRISNHIAEDPYAKLSRPNRQDIRGLELETVFRPTRRLDIQANMTLLDNSGSKERYRFVDFFIQGEDGLPEPVFRTLRHPFDTGPRTMFNLLASWEAVPGLTTFAHLEYFSSRKLIYARGEETQSASGAWLLNAGLFLEDLFTPGLDLGLKVRNMTDNRYRTPGTYSMIKGDGINGEIFLRYVF